MRVLMDHPFEANRSGNPRNALACDRCSRIEAVHPVPRARDRVAEERFIWEALELAKRSGWPLSGAWTKAVDDRLALGDREYGNRALYRDNLPDTLEETPDLGTYAALEEQRMRYEHLPTAEEDRFDLLAVAAHGAAAHFHAQRIVRRRAGLE